MTQSTPPKKDLSGLKAVEIVWDIGISITAPTVIFALGGSWLDKHYGTSPFFLIIGLFLALAVTGWIVIKKGKQIAKDL